MQIQSYILYIYIYSTKFVFEMNAQYSVQKTCGIVCAQKLYNCTSLVLRVISRKTLMRTVHILYRGVYKLYGKAHGTNLTNI